MGAGRVWDRAGASGGVVGARSVLGAPVCLPALHPFLAGPGRTRIRESPVSPSSPHFSSSLLQNAICGVPRGDTGGGPTAGQSHSQTACLGAKYPDFPPCRHHGMGVLTRPQVMGPWPAVSPCFPQGKMCPGGARLQPHISRTGTGESLGSQILPSICDATGETEAGTARTCDLGWDGGCG